MKRLNYRLIIKAEIVMIAICTVVLSFLLYPYFPKVKEQIVLATTVKPETFTELYFVDHKNLPLDSNLGQNNFTFTVHNLENKEMKYPYEVLIERNSQRELFSSGTLEIEKGGYESVSNSFSTAYQDKYKIIVNLVGKKQSIDFWVN